MLAWRYVMAAVLCVAFAVPAFCAPSEYQVKAVFLFNFAQFVEWPSDAFASPTAPFVVGVLGDDPFGADLDSVLRGESIDQHPVLLKRYQSPEQALDCNILFIGRTSGPPWNQILTTLKGHHVLTVSDAGPSGPDGVVIGLLTIDNRIRLRIDLEAAKAANLTISSKLLRSAQIVGGEAGR